MEGRTYPVDLHYLPPLREDEELPAQVARAVDWLDTLDDRGDVLVFLPGEREIREVAEKLEGRNLRNTRILPLFARLGLADQQEDFSSGTGLPPHCAGDQRGGNVPDYSRHHLRH